MIKTSADDADVRVRRAGGRARNIGDRRRAAAIGGDRRRRTKQEELRKSTMAVFGLIASWRPERIIDNLARKHITLG